MGNKNLTIRVSEDLHKKIKMHAASKGMSIKDYLMGLAKKDMDNEKNKQQEGE